MRKNPMINTNKVPLAEDTKYSINNDDFMLAVAAENYDTGEFLGDPRYVRFVTATFEKKNGKMGQPVWY